MISIKTQFIAEVRVKLDSVHLKETVLRRLDSLSAVCGPEVTHYINRSTAPLSNGGVLILVITNGTEEPLRKLLDRFENEICWIDGARIV